ncbi:glycoprotein-N-acetylgalactosamine 3-beta-galactosyltransferase [Fragilaria crotonensis]|nr:glycoprotein-N-acetylgalactosamine 3-beta-galactosyltransferase [Fragilaria crotonensis]
MLSSPTRNVDLRNHSAKYYNGNVTASHAASWVLEDSSSWYGWQPKIHPEADCKWRKCFRDKHRCRKTCRDDPEAMGKSPRESDIPSNWVPDVTILRRMFLAQNDAKGNPWPPPLPKELCEPIGDSGNRRDRNLELLEAIPIVAEPLRGPATGPKILCMIYTVASAHAAQVRAIRETWAGGCDGFLAFSTESDPRIPAISLPHDGEESYDNMWQKVRSIWRFVHKHYTDDFDFFILGGDDLFVLPQNLRSYLAVGAPDSRVFAGRPLGDPGTFIIREVLGTFSLGERSSFLSKRIR